MSVHTMETLALFDSAPYQNAFSARVIAISEQGIALEHTLFYPTGGGQPGDTGHLTLADGTRVQVTGTVRDPVLRSIIWHQVDHYPEQLAAGVQVDAGLDWERRYQHMKMHTCLHLLCSLIDAPVTGCSISADKGRLDFDLPEMTLDKDRHPRPQRPYRTSPRGQNSVDARHRVRDPAADHPHPGGCAAGGLRFGPGD